MTGLHADINPASQSFEFTLDYEKLGLAPSHGRSGVYRWDHKTAEAVWHTSCDCKEHPGTEHRTGYHVRSVRDSLRRGVWKVCKIL